MSDYRDRRKAKQQLASGFRFIPSVGRSAVKAEKLARLHAYDLDPSPYGSWIVVPPRKHATRTVKQRWLQSSRAVNGKAHSVPETYQMPPIPAKPFREYWAYVGRYTAITDERPIYTVWLPPMV